MLSDNDVLNLGEEVIEFLKVELSISILVCQLHPVEGNLLDLVNSQCLSRGLAVEHLKDLVLLLLLLIKNFLLLISEVLEFLIHFLNGLFEHGVEALNPLGHCLDRHLLILQ